MADINARKRGNKWEYYFEGARMDGKRQRISKSGFATKSEALKAGMQAIQDYESMGCLNNADEISVHDYLEFWIEHYCVPNLKAITVSNYRKRIRLHIDSVIGKFKLKSLSAEKLQTLINGMVADGYSKNTIITVKGILSSSLTYAVSPLKYLPSSPMVYVKMPKGSRKDVKQRAVQREAIEPSVITAIFERFKKGSSVYIPMMFGYRCGMRLGEAFAVSWDNVNFESKTVTIDKQLQWDEKEKVWYLTTPKYNSVRTIDLDDFMLNLLKETKERQQRARALYLDEYVNLYCDDEKGINETVGEPVEFVNVRENGGFIQPRTMQHASHIIHEFYPQFDFHSLRHTHTTMLLENNVPIKYVQERLGHKNISVTLGIYNHLTQKQAETSKEKLNNIFG